MVELSKYHGVVWDNLEKQNDIRPIVNKQKCVEKCVKKFKEDPTFYGVVIKTTQGCWCAQNMKYSELESDQPTKRSLIYTGVIRSKGRYLPK